MESSLLQKYLPQFVLDAEETVAPVDLNKLAAGCLVKDDANDMDLKGGIGQNLANSSCYLAKPPNSSPAATTITAAGQQVGNLVTSVGSLPLTGKVDTLVYNGRWFYSLLYMYAFPASEADGAVVHYVKVLVSTDTGAIEHALFGLAGNALQPAVVSAGRLQYTDRVLQHVMVYVSKDRHAPLPKPGRYWKTGAQGETQQCAPGVKWDPSGVESLSNALMQFRGRLAKPSYASVPAEQPWWQSTLVVDVDRIFQRYIDTS